MALPADLTFDSQPDPSDKNYTLFTIQPLQVGTPYQFQFQWIFEDPQLNELVGDNWSNTFEYISKTAERPTPVSNLQAVWEPDGLKITFDHDNSINNGTNNNTGVDEYRLTFTYTGGLGAGGTGTIGTEIGIAYNRDFSKTVLGKTYLLTPSRQAEIGFDFDRFTQSSIGALLKVSVVAVDTLNNVESDAVEISTPEITPLLTAPSISLTPLEFSYAVNWSSSTGQSIETINKLISGVFIEEVVSNSATAPETGYQLVRRGIENPILVPATALQRWVRARFLQRNGIYTPYCEPLPVTPTNPIQDAIDDTAPAPATINSAVWVGNDIVINATVAADAKKFIIKLTNGANDGYFTRFPGATGTSQIITLTKSDLYNVFGQHFTSFTGVFYSADAADNRDNGVNFTVATKTNPLLTVTPTFTLTAITNGYTATWVQPTAASYAKVYESGTSWGAGDPQESDLVFSGQSPAIVKKTVYTQRFVKIRYFTDDGFSSLWSAEQTVTPLDSIGVDINPPSAPTTGLTATAGIDTTGTLGFNGFINLSWTAVSDSTLRGYRIRFRPYKATAPFENYSYVDSPGTGTTYRLGGLAVGTTYELGIASYDEFNNTTASYSSFANTTISGTPSLSNYITAGAAGFQIGSGIKDSTGAQNATAQGIYLSNNNYWYLTAADTARLKIGGSTANYLLWDGTKITIDGDVIAKGGSFSGNIELKTTGASIWNGPLNSGGTLAGDGFVLNNNGLSIRKGSVNLRLDTSDGGIYAQFGLIAGWTIDSTKFEKLVSSTYTGLSTGGTYSFYAGATSSGGDANAQFYVTPAGFVQAKNINISGGQLTIGASSIAASTGKLISTDAEITGKITANSGKIGNINIDSASLYISDAVPPTATTGNRIIFNAGGIAAYPSGAASNSITGSESTKTDYTSMTANFAITKNGTAFFKVGFIGGWEITSSQIKGSTGTASTVLTQNGEIYTNNGTYWVGMVPQSSAGTDVVLWAGQTTGTNTLAQSKSDARFSVTAAGTLKATDANLSGKLSTGSGASIMAFGLNAGGTTGTNGMYIGTSGDYIYDNGNFRLANGKMTYVNSTSTITFDTSSSGIVFNNMPESDGNNWGGDPTVTIDDGTQRLVKGRRFIYDSGLTSLVLPINPSSNANGFTFNTISKTGTIMVGGTSRPVKTGDILISRDTSTD